MTIYWKGLITVEHIFRKNFFKEIILTIIIVCKKEALNGKRIGKGIRLQ